MRLAVLLSLLFVGGCFEARAQALGQDAPTGGVGGNGGMGNGAIGGGFVVPSGAACDPIPDYFVWQFDGDDIDADNSANAAYTNGGYVTSWSNDGGSDPDDADIGQTSNDGYKPTFASDALNGHDAVALDGVADHREISTSTSSGAFVHETGDFHFIFVMRPDSSPIFSTVAANTDTSATDGFIFWFTDAQKMRALVAREAGGTFAFDYTSTFTFTLGEWAVWEVAADSTPPASGTLSTAKNFGAFETQALQNAFGAGAAPWNIVFGAAPSSYAYPFDGAFALILIADRKLSAGERTELDDIIGCRYGL